MRTYEDFCAYLKQHGYQDVYFFINEPSDAKATRAIRNYLARQSDIPLLDGLGRPYKDATAKWYFLAWILREYSKGRARSKAPASFAFSCRRIRG
jgi:hypothetical protein